MQRNRVRLLDPVSTVLKYMVVVIMITVYSLIVL